MHTYAVIRQLRTHIPVFEIAVYRYAKYHKT